MYNSPCLVQVLVKDKIERDTFDKEKTKNTLFFITANIIKTKTRKARRGGKNIKMPQIDVTSKKTPLKQPGQQKQHGLWRWNLNTITRIKPHSPAPNPKQHKQVTKNTLNDNVNAGTAGKIECRKSYYMKIESFSSKTGKCWLDGIHRRRLCEKLVEYEGDFEIVRIDIRVERFFFFLFFFSFQK